MIDEKAPKFGLHKSLVIPIAAKSLGAIKEYVGVIETVFGQEEGVLVSFKPNGLPNNLLVWSHERSYLLNHTTQLWVDIDSKKYRALYMNAFSSIVKDKSQVIDHIMNRKIARSLGYKYVRVLHISRKANSSSGRGGETVAANFLPLSSSLNPEINASDIIYADPMDLLKMLDISVGGFGLDAVSDNHYLFY